MSGDRVLQLLLEEEVGHLRRLEACRADIADIRGDQDAVHPVRGSEWLTQDLGSFEWLIGGLIATETVNIMVADPTIGKTTLLVQLTISLTKGIPFIGHPVAQKYPALTVLAEGSLLAFRNRWSCACKTLGVDPSEIDWYVQPAGMTEYAIGSRGLEVLIEESKAKLVILDTIGYFHSGDENDANDWKRHVMKPLRALTSKYGCSFILVHHQNKAHDKQGWQKGRGTTAMFADYDLLLRLEKPEGQPGLASFRDLYVDKNKYAACGYRMALDFNSLGAVFTQR